MDTKRILMRHLRAATAGFPSREWTANPADPTAVEKTEGWVTFEYDPWRDDPEIPNYPLMGTVYRITILDSWGTEIKLYPALEDGKHAVEAIKRIYVDDTDDNDWNELDRLLDGVFHTDPPELDWLETAAKAAWSGEDQLGRDFDDA